MFCLAEIAVISFNRNTIGRQGSEMQILLLLYIHNKTPATPSVVHACSMAEGGGDLLSLSLQKLDEELKCPVCREHFEEPKVLPCLHYYCKKCVATLIGDVPTGQPIHCPECRRAMQVTDNDPGR